MTIKKAIYHYDNGNGWDEIMFKTTADQVVESSSKRFVSDTEKSTWNKKITVEDMVDETIEIDEPNVRTDVDTWLDFKKNGGDINGHIQLNKGNSFVINDIGWIGTGIDREFEMIQTNKGKVVRLGTTDNLGNHIFVGLDGNDGVYGPSHNNLIELGKSSNTFKDLWLGTCSKNTNGYTKLPNGLIMQWGTAKSWSGGHIWTTYPITFPNAVLSVNLSLITDSVSGIVNCNSYNNSGLNFVSNLNQIDVKWVAIGY